MDFDKLLQLMINKKRLGPFITADAPPSMKVNGTIMPVTKSALTPEQSMTLVKSVMTPSQIKEFDETLECQLPLVTKPKRLLSCLCLCPKRLCGHGCCVKLKPKSHGRATQLPPILNEIAMKKGIVLLVGATGTGKSTTLAAMMGYRNENSRGHIITIEDPIEYVHEQ